MATIKEKVSQLDIGGRIRSACESAPTCPTHDQPIKAETGEWVRGIRPEKSETLRHTLKIN